MGINIEKLLEESGDASVEIYLCPHCKAEFLDEDIAQKHVSECHPDILMNGVVRLKFRREQ